MFYQVMQLNSKIKHLSIKRFLKIGVFKTLYFNFKMLPFSQAIKLPFIISKYTNLYDLTGTIKLNCIPRPGLITIGFAGDDIVDSKSNRGFIDLKGIIEFSGNANIGVGNTIKVGKYGFLSIGRDFTSNYNTRIICKKNIKFGNTVKIAWENIITDTSSHYVSYLDLKKYSSVNGFISIGDNIWIGARCTILQKTVLLNDIIVASNSLCNKDYTKFGNYVLIGGSPVKLIKSNVTRVFDKELEMSLFKEEYEKYIDHD